MQKPIKIKNRNLFITSLGIIFVGIILGIIPFFSSFHSNWIEDKKIKQFLEITATNGELEENTSHLINNCDFSKLIAVIKIPSISLQRGLVSINDRFNNVNKNIQIIKESDMPDVLNGNFILASHSGNSNISYFKNLDKLKIEDKIYVYYNGYEYEYSLDNVYEVEKNENIRIFRDYSKTTITLITCKKSDKNIQSVYIGYLVNQRKY